MNRHDPAYTHRNWSKSEDNLILALFSKFGGKWRKIAEKIPHRHPDAIKNRYYSVIRRRIHKL